MIALLAVAPEAWSAAPADAYARAVRAAFDTPELASAALLALHAQYPEDDDVAWWLARAWLDEGRNEDAGALLAGRSGRKVPAAHFAWLRARAAAVTAPAEARAQVAAALASAPAGDPARTDMLALAARLAWAAGDEPAARAFVADAGGTLPGFLLLAPRIEPGALRVETEGHAYIVTAHGLAVAEEAASCAPPAIGAAPVEVTGPAVLRADGRACLAPGARADLAPGGDGWMYVAVDAPEGEGIHTIAACGAPPRALRRGPGLSSPGWLGDTLLWVEGGSARTEAGAAWPGTEVIRLATGPAGVLAVVWEGGTPRLRYAASTAAPLAPLFAGDPPITRATWCPSPPAARAPGSPPPPPARPR